MEATADANGGGHSVFNFTNADYWLRRDVRATNTNKAAGNYGFLLGSNSDYNTFVRCRADSCYDGFHSNSLVERTAFIDCRAHDNARYGFFHIFGEWGIRCTATNNVYGFSGGYYIACIANGQSVNGFDYVQQCNQCVSYGNAVEGFGGWLPNTAMTPFIDCIAVSNGGYGFTPGQNTVGMHLIRCATFNNTSGRLNMGFDGPILDIDPVILTADPFVNAAGGNFALNDNPTGGLLCKNVNGTLLPGGLTRSYQNIGAAQSVRQAIVSRFGRRGPVAW